MTRPIRTCGARGSVCHGDESLYEPSARKRLSAVLACGRLVGKSRLPLSSSGVSPKQRQRYGGPNCRHYRRWKSGSGFSCYIIHIFTATSCLPIGPVKNLYERSQEDCASESCCGTAITSKEIAQILQPRLMPSNSIDSSRLNPKHLWGAT